jgi:DNA-binding NtrC family response regulator
MRRLICALVIIPVILLGSVAVADACGDKALRIGRGIRFQRTSRPAAVLIYIPSNTARANQVQSMLKKVGHKSYAVQSVDGLSQALKSGQYDLVMTGVSEAASLGNQIESSPSRPVLVAVVSEGTKAQVMAAKKQYRYVVKNPHSAEQYLDAIDDAVRSRVHLIAKKSQGS